MNNDNSNTRLSQSNNDVITFEELYKAFTDCEKHKRQTESYSNFEINLLTNLSQLLEDLNNKTYEIGYSICFVVTRPKLREVYAAEFRDRIVHHLIILKFNEFFEDFFIPSTYNCRKGKGVLYGVKEFEQKIKTMSNNYTEDVYYWKADLKNFFMSIDKPLLYELLERFIRMVYKGDDIEWWLWLIKKVVMHDPQNRRIVKGDPRLLESLPFGKTLSKNYPEKGMAIGNLPSQIFANFLLSILDYFMFYYEGIDYGRYVDDFGAFSKDKELLLWLMPVVRRLLKEEMHVNLHQNKWILQHASKGIFFTGYYIKYGRVYSGNRTVTNALCVAEKGHNGNLVRFVNRMNSYLGFMTHTDSYAIRRNIWDAVPNETKKFIFCTNHFQVIKIRRRYEQVISTYFDGICSQEEYYEIMKSLEGVII